MFKSIKSSTKKCFIKLNSSISVQKSAKNPKKVTQKIEIYSKNYTKSSYKYKTVSSQPKKWKISKQQNQKGTLSQKSSTAYSKCRKYKKDPLPP